MERKYKMMFLLLLLCLVFIEKSYSQKCMTIQYDNNGNRISQYVHECGDEYKDKVTRNLINGEILISDENQEVFVYPNPNDGVFYIDFENKDESDLIIIQIYNNKGVLLKNEYLMENSMVDISNNPSGVYLLRIIKDKYVCSKIVVKL